MAPGVSATRTRALRSASSDAYPLWSGRAAEALQLARGQAVAADREDLGLRADQDLGHVARVGQPGDEHPGLRPGRPLLVQLDPYAHLRMITSLFNNMF